MGWGRDNIGQARTMLWSVGTGILAAGIVRQIPAPAGWFWPERTRDVTNHWTDAFNFLDLVPGPEFLLVYIIYCAGVITIAWLLRNLLLDRLSCPPMVNNVGRLPFSLKPSYLDVAYLRDGREGMLIASICNLVRVGIISPSLEQLPTSDEPKLLQGDRRGLTDLEQAICIAIERGVEHRHLSRDSVVARELSLAETKTRAKLDALGFCTSQTIQRIALATTAAALALIDGLAVIRLIRSSLRGYHNVGLLVILMLFATVIACKVLASVERHHIGTRFLRRLNDDAADVVRRMQAMARPADGAEIMYAIAAGGLAVVQGTQYQEVYEHLARRRQLLAYQGGSSDSSCSSCSGGSCGGGGCGGGGCGGGGCGGGGCGGG